MPQIWKKGVSLALACLAALSAAGCGAQGAQKPGPTESPPQSAPAVPYEIPPFRNVAFHEDQAETFEGLKIDFSSIAEGYVAVRCESQNTLKIQIIKDSTTYTYDLDHTGKTEFYPLSMGNGTYQFKVMENYVDNKYTLYWETEHEVSLAGEFQPFLYPSQIVNYNESSDCVAFARDLAAKNASDLEITAALYEYMVQNIVYDNEKAARAETGYIPDPDSTLREKKGICFDYACLAAASLRSLGIPCKVITGYVDDIYHAWNEIYLENQGWITVEIVANANNWKRVDITFAATGVSADRLENDGLYTTRLTY